MMPAAPSVRLRNSVPLCYRRRLTFRREDEIIEVDIRIVSPLMWRRLSRRARMGWCVTPYGSMILAVKVEG